MGDVMEQIGSCRFNMAAGKEEYDCPMSGSEANLRLRMRDANSAEAQADAAKGINDDTSSPARKLQTALSMRSYLDNHDVLRQMQELLQDMVTDRPDNPIDYMIRRLEEVSQENAFIEIDSKDDFSSIVVKDKGVDTAPTAAAP